MSIVSKPLAAGSVVIWQEHDVGDQYEYEHSLVVRPAADGAVIETKDVEVFIPWYSVDDLAKVLRAMAAQHRREAEAE